MARVTRAELVAVLAALGALVASARVLRWAIDKTDPRSALLRTIARQADPRRDLLIIADEAPELARAAWPLPAVYNVPAPENLAGLRTLYVLGLSDTSLVPFDARFGPATAELGSNARKWQLAGIASSRLSLANVLLERAQVRRLGGRFEGPCPRVGSEMHCNSVDVWNHVRSESQPIRGASTPCVFAHPQADGEVEIMVPDTPPARALVGMVAIADTSLYPDGRPVVNRMRFEPSDGSAPVESEVTAPNRPGPTPYRLDLGGRAGRMTFRISVSVSGARSYCFTAHWTD